MVKIKTNLDRSEHAFWLRKSKTQKFKKFLDKQEGGASFGGTVATTSDQGFFTPTYGGGKKKRKKHEIYKEFADWITKQRNPNLVPKKVQVQGKKGTYTGIRWVKPSEGSEEQKPKSKPESKPSVKPESIPEEFKDIDFEDEQDIRIHLKGIEIQAYDYRAKLEVVEGDYWYALDHKNEFDENELKRMDTQVMDLADEIMKYEELRDILEKKLNEIEKDELNAVSSNKLINEKFEGYLETLSEDERENYSQSKHEFTEGVDGGINDVFLHHLDSGMEIIFKPESGESLARPEMPRPLYVREVGAYIIAEAIGINDFVPITVLREHNGEIGSAQEKIVGAEEFPLYDFWSKSDVALPSSVIKGALLDAVIGNTDRHEYNIIKSGDEIYGIDHGFSMPDHQISGRKMRGTGSAFEDLIASNNKSSTGITSGQRESLNNFLHDKKTEKILRILFKDAPKSVDMMYRRVTKILELGHFQTSKWHNWSGAGE